MQGRMQTRSAAQRGITINPPGAVAAGLVLFWGTLASWVWSLL
jgi:hypothetical protein